MIACQKNSKEDIMVSPRWQSSDSPNYTNAVSKANVRLASEIAGDSSLQGRISPSFLRAVSLRMRLQPGAESHRVLERSLVRFSLAIYELVAHHC